MLEQQFPILLTCIGIKYPVYKGTTPIPLYIMHVCIYNMHTTHFNYDVCILV